MQRFKRVLKNYQSSLKAHQLKNNNTLKENKFLWVRRQVRSKLDVFINLDYLNFDMCLNLWFYFLKNHFIIQLLSRKTYADNYSTSLLSSWYSKFCYWAMLFSTKTRFSMKFTEVVLHHRNNKNIRIKLPYITASKNTNIIYLLSYANHQTLECHWS